MEKKNKSKPKAWTPGTSPGTGAHRAEAIKALREKLEAITGKPATEAEVNLNTILWEICQLFKLNDSQIEIALGKEGAEAIRAKVDNAVWH